MMARRPICFFQVADPDWMVPRLDGSRTGWFFNLIAVGIVKKEITEVKKIFNRT